MPEASGEAGVTAALGPLREEPSRAAVLTDIDGTLAPIVTDPGEAGISDEARKLLAALASRYAVVGCVSGRRAAEARDLVGVEEIAYAGNHGLELLLPGESEVRLDPALEGRENQAAEYLARLDGDAIGAFGLRLEDKGPIQALHWRGVEDESAAEARAREIAAEAGRAGLDARWGRKVLELRPTGGGGKDAAVAALLTGAEVESAVYAGDDRTDLDAFRRLRELAEGGDLRRAVCVGVVSDEGPAEIAAEADLTAEGPEGWVAMLRQLAG
jgi:trehalose 6-phosphate phosphatase